MALLGTADTPSLAVESRRIRTGAGVPSWLAGVDRTRHHTRSLMRPMSSAGGWKAISYTLRMANQVGWLPLWRAMRSQERLQDLRAGHGRPARRHGQRGGPLARRSARSRSRRWSPTCRAASRPSSSRGIPSPSCETLSPRELESCGRLVASVYAGAGDTHYRVIAWDEALDRLAAKLTASWSATQLLLRQRPVVERSRLPAAALRAAVRHQLRQQLLLLLPPGERRRLGREPRHRHGHGRSSTTSSTATSSS